MTVNIQNQISLLHFNSFGVDVRAKNLIEINDKEELRELFSMGFVKNQLLILGRGSNILFVKDYEGLVIKMNIKGISGYTFGKEAYVEAGAGEEWKELVNYCVQNGFAGIENLSYIPGSVGAAPVQNIGAYGVELKDVFYSLEAFDTQTLTFEKFSLQDCWFDYRDSVFKSRYKSRFIICSVTLRLSLESSINTAYGAIETELLKRNITKPNIKDVSEVVTAIRKTKLPDPSVIGNAGSFFKNPVISRREFDFIYDRCPNLVHYFTGDNHVKLAAGWLIEQCGWKGKKVGHTGTWSEQALVLVNYGEATGMEIYTLSESIIKSVKDKFGITLEREVNIV